MLVIIVSVERYIPDVEDLLYFDQGKNVYGKEMGDFI